MYCTESKLISNDHNMNSKWQQLLLINFRLRPNRQQKLTDSRMPLLAAFYPWGFFFKWSSMKARRVVLHSFFENLGTLPSFFWILVCKWQNVRCSPAAITDHNWERGVFPQTLQDDGDHIGTSFHYEPNYRNTLPQSCKSQKNRNKEKKECNWNLV